MCYLSAAALFSLGEVETEVLRWEIRTRLNGTPLLRECSDYTPSEQHCFAAFAESRIKRKTACHFFYPFLSHLTQHKFISALTHFSISILHCFSPRNCERRAMHIFHAIRLSSYFAMIHFSVSNWSFLFRRVEQRREDSARYVSYLLGCCAFQQKLTCDEWWCYRLRTHKCHNTTNTKCSRKSKNIAQFFSLHLFYIRSLHFRIRKWKRGEKRSLCNLIHCNNHEKLVRRLGSF